METQLLDASQTGTTGGDVQLVTFRLDSQEYALPIANVVQVVRIVAITPLPEAPDIVRGVINVRGRIVPVVDTRKRFGLRDKPYDLNTQLLIARHDGRMIALVVDEVSEVLNIQSANIEPPSRFGAQADAVSAMGKLCDRLLLILDPGKILDSEERNHAEQFWNELRAMLMADAEGRQHLRQVLLESAGYHPDRADRSGL